MVFVDLVSCKINTFAAFFFLFLHQEFYWLTSNTTMDGWVRLGFGNGWNGFWNSRLG